MQFVPVADSYMAKKIVCNVNQCDFYNSIIDCLPKMRGNVSCHAISHSILS